MNKKLNIDHIFIQFIYYVAAALTWAFGTYTMLSRGVSSTTIGTLIAIADLLSMLLQIVISNILDNSNKVNTIQMSIIISVLLFVTTIINYLLNVPSISLYINYICYQSLISILMTLCNQISGALANQGININFGIARALGSFSFAITCFIYGVVTEKHGYKSITLSMAIMSLMIIAIFVITQRHFKQEKSIKVKQDNIPFKDFIARHKYYILTCIGFASIMCGYSAIENFYLPIIENCGGTNLDSSILQGLKAIFEIPIIYFFPTIEKKINLKTIFFVSGLSFTLKTLVLVFSATTLPIYISQILQTTSYALLIPAMISYINKIMSQKELARGHSMQSIVQTLFGMIYVAISGVIIDDLGIKMFCSITTILTFIGMIIITLSIKEKKSSD